MGPRARVARVVSNVVACELAATDRCYDGAHRFVHDHMGAVLHALVQVEDVLIEQTDAAG